MAKVEIGEKRRCLNCSTPFFDLNRNPIVCPKCTAIFHFVEIVRSSSKYARARLVESSGAAPASTFPVEAVLLDVGTEDGEITIQTIKQHDETEKSEVPSGVD
jgi:uncharacterized protein (TIGR02300 family)